MIGRPVSMHAMRGISAHSNGFDTCRLIHILQILIGSIDVPGGFRYKAPYPNILFQDQNLSGLNSIPNTSYDGMPLGFPHSPEDLLTDENEKPIRMIRPLVGKILFQPMALCIWLLIMHGRGILIK